MEHVVAVFQEFDPIPTPNKEIMICYFWECLIASMRAQLDAQGRDLNSSEEAIEKTVNAEVKALLQSSSNTREMDSRYPQESKPTKKEEKDSRKTKSADFPTADTPSKKCTHQSQTNKKDQNY